MRALWVPAVNNAARFGRWEFLMPDNPYDIVEPIRRLIAARLPLRAA